MSRRELSEDAIDGIQALDATIELIDERLPCSHGVVQDAKDLHDAVILLLLAATHALARGHDRPPSTPSSRRFSLPRVRSGA